MNRLLWALAFAGALSAAPVAAQNAGTQPNFQPAFGRGQTVTAATTSTAATAFTGIDVANTELYVFNSGTGIAFARWGVGAQTATTADVPLPPGSVQVFNKGSADNFAAISAAGTNAVLIITGKGR